ncbi:MAG: ParB/RepB/Spo0J family partition protein [Bacteroidota bacterium]|nr:ParB/RepB/Spo0J family partition protein [Bacteroidota bacterium]
MKKDRNALGRGLSSILGVSNDSSKSFKIEKKSNTLNKSENFTNISVSQIIINPFQPREKFNQEKLNELAISIENLGIIQPITVRRMNNNNYQLISGERRLRAAKLIGLKKIPAFIRIANDQETLEMALIENIQRENLNPIEIALSYKRLIDEVNLSQEACSERVGKSRSTVANFLRLLKLPLIIQKGLREQVISNGHARPLLAIHSEESQINLFHDIVAHGYSVREVEQICKEFFDKKYVRVSKKTETPDLSFSNQKLLHDISKSLNTDINIKMNKKGKGKLVIYFENEEDLLRITNSFNK